MPSKLATTIFTAIIGDAPEVDLDRDQLMAIDEALAPVRDSLKDLMSFQVPVPPPEDDRRTYGFDRTYIACYWQTCKLLADLDPAGRD